MEKSEIIIVAVKKVNKSFIINEVETGRAITLEQEHIPEWMLRKAVKHDVFLLKKSYKHIEGKVFWRQVEKDDYMKAKEAGIEIPTRRSNRKRELFN
jgi:hypothetical protein